MQLDLLSNRSKSHHIFKEKNKSRNKTIYSSETNLLSRGNLPLSLASSPVFRNGTGPRYSNPVCSVTKHSLTPGGSTQDAARPESIREADIQTPSEGCSTWGA